MKKQNHRPSPKQKRPPHSNEGYRLRLIALENMALRLADRRARLLKEFGWTTAEELAKSNESQAANRHALVDNWKKRRQVFSVPHRDAKKRLREVFPLFQFEDHRPIKAVRDIIEAFGERKSPWKLALWFTYSNPNDLVVDPFAGSGSTGIAAESEGRRFIGWDLSPRFGCD